MGEPYLVSVASPFPDLSASPYVGGGHLMTDNSGVTLFPLMAEGHGSKVGDGAVLTDQLGTPRGRCDEHNSKFSLSYETKV
jgi:hypothetical protein